MLLISMEDFDTVKDIIAILEGFQQGTYDLHEGALESEYKFTEMDIHTVSESELFVLTNKAYLDYYGSGIGFGYTELFAQFTKDGPLAFNEALYRMRNLTKEKLTVNDAIYYSQQTDSYELMDTHFLLTRVLDLLEELVGL